MPIFVKHWEYNLQFYPNFALFSTLGGMNLDHDFVQMSKLSEDEKKGLHQKCNTFFPRIQVTFKVQLDETLANRTRKIALRTISRTVANAT